VIYYVYNVYSIFYILKTIILDNVTESKIEEMEHVNIQKLAIDTDNSDNTSKVVEMQTTEHLVSGNFLKFLSIMSDF